MTMRNLGKVLQASEKRKDQLQAKICLGLAEVADTMAEVIAECQNPPEQNLS